MLRYPPKRQATKTTPSPVKPRRDQNKPLKTKIITAPAPDPRLVPSGTPLISYVLTGFLLAGLALCAHFTNALPAPGDQLAVPAGQSVASKSNIASPHEVSAKVLGNVLAGSGPSCILSENALRADGGSFSVLAHRPDGVVLSWAGPATARTSPCPAGAPLLVSAPAYQSLNLWRPAPAYER